MGAMLPVFMVGLVVGILLATAYFEFKKDTPSNVKIEWLEKEVARQKNDNELLNKLNKNLYDKISELESELSDYKEANHEKF